MKAQQKPNLAQNISRLCHCLATLLLMAWLSATVQAAPGDLDLSFGNGGIVVTPITDAANLYEEANAILVQPDGKIVVCGVVNFSNEETSFPVSTFLVRYHPNGTLDASFGTNGKVIWNGNTHAGYNLALQPDGKILAVGHSFPGGPNFVVHRYNSDGTLDASFGPGGIVTLPVIGGAQDVALQPNGKIIIIGNDFGAVSDNDFAVVRLNPNGSLDNSFGTGGKVSTAMRNESSSDEPCSVVLQPDGKIVLVGTSVVIGSRADFALARFNADGSLDSGFGVNGKVIHSHSSNFVRAFDSVLQADGKIVVAGSSFLGGGQTAVVRYNPNGSIDTGFAVNGIFSPEDGFSVGRSIALQPDGKIVAFGSGVTGSGFSGFAMARLNPNGTPDASFGTNGRLITPIGTNDSSAAFAGTLQPDRRILAFGTTHGSDGDHIALTRHHGDSAFAGDIDDPTFFVRQHYLDFLSREPDPVGLAFWTNEITSCGGDIQCVEIKRINVSAAFFLSIEFQETGYLVYRMYKAAYGDTSSPNVTIPVPIIRLHEFLPDAQRMGQGVQVGIDDWREQLEANKNSYAREFVTRQRFITAYPLTMSAVQFVDELNQNAGDVLSLAERDDLIVQLNAAADVTVGRATGLLRVAENGDLLQREKNQAFVLMQYYGYLRRNPDRPPDSDFRGWEFWLNKLNEFNGNFIDAEMVKAFLVSSEYRQRFGSP